MGKKVLLIAATRPNFMKVAPIFNYVRNNKVNFDVKLLHTGQHYDDKMSKVFFDQLNLPTPDINLSVGSNTHTKQIAEIMVKFEDYVLDCKPDIVLAPGDVNSTLACSLVCSKLRIPLGHIESGLRSFDSDMPEEINRIVTDRISDYLYTPSVDANENLIKEGVSEDKIIFVGNIMIDTLKDQLREIDKIDLINHMGLYPKKYMVLTLHRPSNVDNKQVLESLIHNLLTLSSDKPIIFPIHPRTKNNILNFKLEKYFNFNNTIQLNKINAIDSLGYQEMLSLVKNSQCVITDSGGLQEETTYLKVPCFTVRENTERPITITSGSNNLVGLSRDLLIEKYNELDSLNYNNYELPKFWDGQTSIRIVNHLISLFN